MTGFSIGGARWGGKDETYRLGLKYPESHAEVQVRRSQLESPTKETPCCRRQARQAPSMLHRRPHRLRRGQCSQWTTLAKHRQGGVCSSGWATTGVGIAAKICRGSCRVVERDSEEYDGEPERQAPRAETRRHLHCVPGEDQILCNRHRERIISKDIQGWQDYGKRLYRAYAAKLTALVRSWPGDAHASGTPSVVFNSSPRDARLDLSR